MSFTDPAYQIPRQSVAGMENEWIKMFDPPQTGGSKGTTPMPTRELLAPTNPVPAFIAANVPLAGMSIPNTVRRTLLHKVTINMWDGKPVRFFTFADVDIPTVGSGVYPAPTIRVAGPTATHRRPRRRDEQRHRGDGMEQRRPCGQ